MADVLLLNDDGSALLLNDEGDELLLDSDVPPPPADCPPPLSNVLIGDYDAGHVRQTFADDEDDDGELILWTVLARPVAVGTPQSLAYYRRMILKVTDVVADQAILARLIFGPIVAGTPRVIERELHPPSFVGLGLGDLLYNSEVDLDMAVGLTATNVRPILAGFGKIRIRGLEYHVRQKPLNYPSPYAIG